MVSKGYYLYSGGKYYLHNVDRGVIIIEIIIDIIMTPGGGGYLLDVTEARDVRQCQAMSVGQQLEKS